MSADDEIGYRKPPKAGQFQKGKSGNSTGRPKGSRNLKTDLEAELAETIRVSVDGTPQTMSKQRAMLKSLTAKALKGDARAANTVLGLIQKLLDQDPTTESGELASEDRAILAAHEERVRQRLLAEKKDRGDE